MSIINSSRDDLSTDTNTDTSTDIVHSTESSTVHSTVPRNRNIAQPVKRVPSSTLLTKQTAKNKHFPNIIALIKILHSKWRKALNLSLTEDASIIHFTNIVQTLNQTKEFLPLKNEIFAALNHYLPSNVKVCIIGQDPYPTPGHTHGLSLSVQPSC